MSCAACQARVEKAVRGVPGVEDCQVNLLTNSMSVSGNAAEDAVIKAVVNAGYGAQAIDENSGTEIGKDASDKEVKELLIRLIVSVLLSAIVFVLCMKGMYPDVQRIIAIIVMIINYRFFVNGFKGIIHLAPNMDTLVALGSTASLLYGYYDSAAMILALITVGKTLEARAKGRTTNAIRALMKLVPQVDIRVGEEFEVKPGESIPADAIVIEGVSAVDESALTGESIPVDKEAGNRVSAGTINKSGYLRCRALRVGNDTTLGQIIKTVSDASAQKAPIAKIADKVSGIFVPAVIGIAAVTFLCWMAFSDMTLGYCLKRAVSVLVISCPCALGLATPVAIMVGSGIGARNGILFKTAVSLERVGKADTAVLDKTGTITSGNPVVTDIFAAAEGSCGRCPDCEGAGTCSNFEGASESELLRIAYALEAKSEHPLAKAVVEYVIGREDGRRADDADSNIYETADNFRALSGSGVEGELRGDRIVGGSRKFIESIVELDEAAKDTCDRLSSEGKTPLLFAKNDKLTGIIAAADAIKDDSADAIAQLKKLGLKIVMLTGDNERTANAIGKAAGVDEVIAGVLPEEKAASIGRLQNEEHDGIRGRNVIMVGDGINDAPALTRADMGIAIGAGTDVAIDAADVVLMKSSLNDVPAAIRLSRKVIKNIYENLFWAFFYNIIGIPLAAGVWIPITGWEISPMFCAAAMSLSSFCVVTNALRLNLLDIYDGAKDKAVKRDQALAKKKTKVTKKENKMFKTTVEVTGMMCPMCEKHTNEAIGKAFDVIEVVSNHDENKTVIKSAGRLDEAKLAEVITAAGYKPGAVSVEEE